MHGTVDAVRKVYDRAVQQVPPTEEKRHWRRYIYLWINYAFYEELHANDLDRTRDIYKQCIKLIPHRAFTFAKVWLAYADFEVRRLRIDDARKALGHAIGAYPKGKLFKGYIELELQLREFNRCRKLYTNYLAHEPSNCAAWIRYAEMEQLLGEDERCRRLYDLAIDQAVLDLPEILWKAYIDFEYTLEEFDRARALYERLLQRTDHVKVWLSYVAFETSLTVAEESVITERCRALFRRAHDSCKVACLKEEVCFPF